MAFNKINRFVLLFCFASLICCSYIENFNNKRRVYKMYDSNVVLPSSLLKIQNADTATISINIKHKTLVYYYSPSDCIDCAIGHLSDIEPIFELRDSISATFDILPLLSPDHTQLSHITRRLINISWKYPVFIDSFNTFEKNNQIPKDSKYHCFLLDESSRIVFVGNPLSNNELRTLFFQVINN